MAHIVVFGTCHNVQGAQKWQGRGLDDAQYKVALGQLFEGKDFIFEEATGLGPTTAETLTLNCLGAEHYLDIDPPVDQRNAYGLADHSGNSQPIDPYDPLTDFLNEEPAGQQSIRETLWIRRVQEKTFQNGLLLEDRLSSRSICGRFPRRTRSLTHLREKLLYHNPGTSRS